VADFPFATALIVIFVAVVTAEVFTVNVPVWAPAAMVKVAGLTVATPVLLLEAVTEIAPGAAFACKVTVAVTLALPVTLLLLSFTDATPIGATVSAVLAVLPLKLALIVDLPAALTADVFTVKVAVLLPAGTVTDVGTVATAVLLLLSATVELVDSVFVSVTVPVAAVDPTTGLGLTLTEATDVVIVTVTLLEPVPPGLTTCTVAVPATL
jgi:hypothetical protein